MAAKRRDWSCGALLPDGTRCRRVLGVRVGDSGAPVLHLTREAVNVNRGLLAWTVSCKCGNVRRWRGRIHGDP